MADQIPLKCLARVLASQITVENNPLGLMVSASKSRFRIFILSSGAVPWFAWCPVIIEGAPYLDSTISLFRVIVNLFYLPAEFLIFLLTV